MKKVLLFLFVMLAAAKLCKATHNRAGYISYTWVSGFTYTFTVTTYTNLVPVYVQGYGYETPPDRCQLTIYFGDGDSCVANRTNNVIPGGTCYPAGQGVEVVPGVTQYNTYSCTHTFAGPGKYWITMGDPNRNANIDNIPNSVNISFFVRSLLVINPALGGGHNNSPVLLNPPLQDGCVNECFFYNPGAYDPDGDSLSFGLTPCLTTSGDTGITIPGWAPPALTPGGTYSINPVLGDFEWCSPPLISNSMQPAPIQSEWNIGITVYEWQSGYLVGTVELDMQINIYICNNKPPLFLPLNDTCVVAGTKISFPVTAYDSEHNGVSLAAVGGPLSPFIISPTATFDSTGFVRDTARSVFTWNTACVHIRKQPYIVTFKAVNNDANSPNPIPLVNYKSITILVVPPPPKNLKAKSSGSVIHLSWSPDTCSNNLVDYYIYRMDSCGSWQHAPCQTGVPSSSGYSLIGSSTTTNFTDNNNGSGLVRGINYSYIVVAVYSDGSESYASIQVCTHLVRDVPVITNVDVLQTDPALGKIRVKWIKPLADTADFDTTKYAGPYRYELLRYSGFGIPGTPISGFYSRYFASLSRDTSYTDTLLNTSSDPYTYRIDFYYKDSLKVDSIKAGSTDNASSVFLSITPALPGNILTLSWQENVPWVNSRYVIYRQNQQTHIYDSIGQTSQQSYSDSNLVNKHLYCYLVKSIGIYSDTSIPRPLINHSEEKCAVPEDKIPPCPPLLNAMGNCTRYTDSLAWTNPDNISAGTRKCNLSKDVVEYRVYYTPVEGQPYQLKYDTKNAVPYQPYQTGDTIYTLDSLTSIAGCFAVTAIDSSGNESAYSNSVCVDNCPVYTLPNVFSPNGDGENDYLKAFPYQFIKDIDLEIYDRWGVLEYKTSDAAFKWDGTNMYSHKPVSDGTYYYVCIVNEIHYEGIIPRALKGFVQILQSKGDPLQH